jgi:HSP20 family protein
MARALTPKRLGADITPWRELDLFPDRMRRMFDPTLGETFFKTPLWAEAEEWMPAVELVEEDGEYVLSAELPGMSKKDVDIFVDDNVLTLKGEKKTERKEEEGRSFIHERRYGAFERSFTLPRNVDPEKIKAEFHDGIVEVHLPRGEESKARQIAIK